MAFSTVTLGGTYKLPDGTIASGTIEIIPSERQIIDDAGNVILSGRVKVQLDALGSFSVALPATDDVRLTPTGFGYTVVAKMHHTHLPAVSFSLPAALVTVDITDVTSVDPSTFNPDATYYTAAETDAAIAAGGGGGGAVSSVNTLTGDVVLDAAAVGADPAGSAATAQAAAIQRANHTGTQDAATVTGLAAVATSGDYDDLDNRPTFKTVTNRTGSTIPANTLVEINGAFGVRSTIRVADKATADHVAGITVAAIADNADGEIQVTGTVENLATNGLTAGTPLYLGTAGAWTETHPTEPDHTIRVGVTGVIHPTAGSVVFSLPAFELLTTNIDGLAAALAAKATTAALTSHTGDVANPHAVTKAQVGLANVDNTADTAKPVSTAQQTALDGKAATSHTHVATTDLTATGTKDATTFLRGDDTWAVPAGGGSSPDGPTPRAAGAFMVHPAGGATTTGIFGFIYLTPMVLSAAINIDQVGIEMTTAQAAANTVMIGYYTQNAGGTLDLQATFGTVASDSTGVKIVSGTWTLPDGPIWLGFSATANGGAFRAASTIAMPGPLWVSASAQISNSAHGLRAGGAGGTLPNPLTPSVSGDVAMPRYVFRKA